MTSLGYISRNQQTFHTKPKSVKDKALSVSQTEIPTEKRYKNFSNSFFSDVYNDNN